MVQLQSQANALWSEFATTHASPYDITWDAQHRITWDTQYRLLDARARLAEAVDILETPLEET